MAPATSPAEVGDPPQCEAGPEALKPQTRPSCFFFSSAGRVLCGNPPKACGSVSTGARYSLPPRQAAPSPSPGRPCPEPALSLLRLGCTQRSCPLPGRKSWPPGPPAQGLTLPTIEPPGLGWASGFEGAAPSVGAPCPTPQPCHPMRSDRGRGRGLWLGPALAEWFLVPGWLEGQVTGAQGCPKSHSSGICSKGGAGCNLRPHPSPLPSRCPESWEERAAAPGAHRGALKSKRTGWAQASTAAP